MDRYGDDRGWGVRERDARYSLSGARPYRGERDRWGNPLPDERVGIWGSRFSPRHDRDYRDAGGGYGEFEGDYGPLTAIEYREPGYREGSPYGGREYGRGYDSPRPSDFGDERDESWSAQLGRDPYAAEPGRRELSWYYGGSSSRDRSDPERDDEHRGRGPRGYTREDARIYEDVCEMLTRHGRIDASDVEVTVEGGEVRLVGTVETRAQKRLAEEVASRASGVKDVHNALRAVTTMAERGGGEPITVSGQGALSSRRGD